MPEHSIPGMLVLQILLGAISLLAGRKLFWLFVAVVGFVFGFRLGMQWLSEEAGLMMAAVAGLVLAILGALLAVFAQKLAIWIIGALAMGAGANYLLLIWQPEATLTAQAIAHVAGAVAGLILAGALFNFVLIAASVLWGAALIVHSFDPRPQLGLGLFVVLSVVGLWVQSSMLRERA